MERSRYINNEAVANNSAIVHDTYSRLHFYCSTRKAERSVAIIYPNGQRYDDSYTRDGYRLVSPSQISVSNPGSRQRLPTGIYTCIDTDSSGLDTMEINIGIYDYFLG